MDSLTVRKNILKKFKGAPAQIEALLDYNKNSFNRSCIESGLTLPLENEPFVNVWKSYIDNAQKIGVFPELKKRLYQLNFPIAKGARDSVAYQLAIKRGDRTVLENQPGVKLESPGKIKLFLHATFAGDIPVIEIPERQDFVSFIQCLTCKCEPKPIPDSLGALFVSGYNNWDRINTLKDDYFKTPGFNNTAWSQLFRTIIQKKQLYQDKFILLSHGYYSGVSPEMMNLEKQNWMDLSKCLRLEHESTHYFTKRVLSAARNNMMDELIADFIALKKCMGVFKANHFLMFLGLEEYPRYRKGGRLENYRGTPPLDDVQFELLQRLLYHSANTLELFDCEPLNTNCMIVTLSQFTLEELAAENAIDNLREKYESILHLFKQTS